MSEASDTTLLVYIPTYNRPDSLRKQVSALVSQRSDWPGCIRILVSDNASDAYTAEAVEAIATEFDVEVRRNSGNIGANANISLGFVLARDEMYLWILSDNDTIAPGALLFIAENGLDDASDAIVFSTKIHEVADVAHTWASAWDGVGESGLISNVIYRLEVFEPYAAQAFFYHNTSFPHLAVLLSALKERGTLRNRVLPSSRVFAPETPHGEYPGDYSLSLSGMPQLLPLLPDSQARLFARKWLWRHGAQFYRARERYPMIHVMTKACVRTYGGARARALMCAFGARHALFGRFDASAMQLARRFVPADVRSQLRRTKR